MPCNPMINPMCRPNNIGCGMRVPSPVEADSCASSGVPTCVGAGSPSRFQFPTSEFLSEFPEFGNSTYFTEPMIARIGKDASRYITEWRCDFPLPEVEDRMYALFLMTAHLLALRKNASDEMSDGSLPAGGRVRKAVVGAVTVETDIPKTSGDYNYWLSQTSYGQELLAYLENSAPAGIFSNCWPDTVRVM